jgi:hypothetical protein
MHSVPSGDGKNFKHVFEETNQYQYVPQNEWKKYSAAEQRKWSEDAQRKQ